jgi:hypothetical protein
LVEAAGLCAGASVRDGTWREEGFFWIEGFYAAEHGFILKAVHWALFNKLETAEEVQILLDSKRSFRVLYAMF